MSAERDEIYSPPGQLTIVQLTEHLMKSEGWGWSKAMSEAMDRRRAAHERREQERQRRRQGRGE